jgi:hypothetical protein
MKILQKGKFLFSGWISHFENVVITQCDRDCQKFYGNILKPMSVPYCQENNSLALNDHSEDGIEIYR